MDLWLWAPRLPSALTADLSTIASGTHTITVFADDVGRIAESDKKTTCFRRRLLSHENREGCHNIYIN
jgi:hypothetical protein